MPAKALVPISFANGINQRIDPRWLPEGYQTSIVNGVHEKTGSISKRRGYIKLGQTFIDGTNITSAKKLVPFQDELLLFDGTQVDVYSPTLAKWRQGPPTPGVIATRTSLAQSPSGISDPDVASSGIGYTAFAWVSYGDGLVYVTVIDDSTGAEIYSSYALTGPAPTNCTCPRVCIVGATVVVLWRDSTTGIRARTLNLATPTAWTGEVTLRNDVDTINPAGFDVAVSGARFYIIYNSNSANPSIRVYAYLSNLTQTNTVSLSGSGGGINIIYVGIAASALNVWVVMTTGGGSPATMYAVLTTALTVSLAPTLVRTSPNGFISATIAESIAGTAYVLVNENINAVGIGSQPSIVTSTVTSGAVVTTIGIPQNGCRLWSKVATRLGVPYAVLDAPGGGGDGFRTLVLANMSAGQAVPYATIAPRFASTARDNKTLASLPFLVPTLAITPAKVQIGQGRIGLNRVDFDFNHPNTWLSTQLGETVYTASGTPGYFDGSVFGELGFLHPPYITSGTGQAGGSMTASSTYTYVAVYVIPDARGQLHRSQASAPFTVGLAAGQGSAALNIGPYWLTNRQYVGNSYSPPVAVEIYRNTQVDLANFRRITTVNTSSAPSSRPNLATAITYTDTASDASIASNPLVYTTGGVLDSQAPPASSCMIAHRGRIILAGEDGVTHYPSTVFVPNEAVRFNDALAYVISDGGRTTAMASMDDKWVVFKSRMILYVTGFGPNDLGEQSDFSEPIRISSDTGCISANSVVVAPMGVFFQADQGIYLLTRALEVIYAGSAVEDTVRANPYISSAVLIPSQGQVRWTCSPSQSSSTGAIIVYDYIGDAWSVFQLNFSGAANAAAVTATVDATGDYYIARSQGQVYREGAGTNPITDYQDDGNDYFEQVEIAWLKPGGLRGKNRFRRLHLLEEPLGEHTLLAEVAYDFSPTYSGETHTFTGIPATGVAERMVYFSQQRAASVRVRFTEQAPGGSPTSRKGPTFVGAQVEFGQFEGGTRIPAGQRG